MSRGLYRILKQHIENWIVPLLDSSRNALLHSHSSSVEVDCIYEPSQAMSVASLDRVVVKFQRIDKNQRPTKAQSNLGWEININYENTIDKSYEVMLIRYMYL